MTKRNIWVISDTHFNHVKSLLWRSGPFSDLDEMNRLMIHNWNSVVGPSDYVYHLGDVFFGSKEKFENIWNQLNGQKRLVVGNHDDIRFLSGKNAHGVYYFKKIAMWRQIEIGGVNMLMTHAPLHPSALTESRKNAYNVFGHIHNNSAPPGNYRCVCVEHTNYTPVHLEDIAKEAKNGTRSAGTFGTNQRAQRTSSGPGSIYQGPTET